MSFEEYIAAAEEENRKYHYIRRGQAYFNMLSRINKDLARQAIGTDFDPFNDDENLPDFLEWVQENWS